MAEQLRMHIALTENLALVLGTPHSLWLTTAYNSSSRGSYFLFRPPQASTHTLVYLNSHRSTYAHK